MSSTPPRFATANPSPDYEAYADTSAATAAGALVRGEAAARALFVGVAGTVTVTRLDGTSVTLPAAPAGFVWPVMFKAISGGTGSSLVVFW